MVLEGLHTTLKFERLSGCFSAAWKEGVGEKDGHVRCFLVLL